MVLLGEACTTSAECWAAAGSTQLYCDVYNDNPAPKCTVRQKEFSRGSLSEGVRVPLGCPRPVLRDRGRGWQQGPGCHA